MGFKSFNKQEAKVIRDLGVAKDDFLYLDNEISIHQANGATRFDPKVIVYEAAAAEFETSRFNYTVNRTSQGNGKTLINFIDWNV